MFIPKKPNILERTPFFSGSCYSVSLKSVVGSIIEISSYGTSITLGKSSIYTGSITWSKFVASSILNPGDNAGVS